MEFVRVTQFGDEQQCISNSIRGAVYKFGFSKTTYGYSEIAIKDCRYIYNCHPIYATTFSLTFIF